MMLFLYSDAVKFYIKILVDYQILPDTTRYYHGIILPPYITQDKVHWSSSTTATCVCSSSFFFCRSVISSRTRTGPITLIILIIGLIVNGAVQSN
jgi:hypothetical protein